MTLITENGMVEFIMKTGKDFVKSKISEAEALTIIKNGKTEITDTHKGFPLCVNGKYYFPEVPELPKEGETPDEPETPPDTDRKKR